MGNANSISLVDPVSDMTVVSYLATDKSHNALFDNFPKGVLGASHEYNFKHAAVEFQKYYKNLLSKVVCGSSHAESAKKALKEKAHTMVDSLSGVDPNDHKSINQLNSILDGAIDGVAAAAAAYRENDMNEFVKNYTAAHEGAYNFRKKLNDFVHKNFTFDVHVTRRCYTRKNCGTGGERLYGTGSKAALKRRTKQKIFGSLPSNLLSSSDIPTVPYSERPDSDYPEGLVDDSSANEQVPVDSSSDVPRHSDGSYHKDSDHSAYGGREQHGHNSSCNFSDGYSRSDDCYDCGSYGECSPCGDCSPCGSCGSCDGYKGGKHYGKKGKRHGGKKH